MIRYALRRMAFYLIAFWAAITLNFLLPRLMPSDPATVLFARFQGRLKPEALEALKQTFGINDAPHGNSISNTYPLSRKEILVSRSHTFHNLYIPFFLKESSGPYSCLEVPFSSLSQLAPYSVR